MNILLDKGSALFLESYAKRMPIAQHHAWRRERGCGVLAIRLLLDSRVVD
jgi:hypothetical protein